MTKDEALKLALEALEASHFLIHGSETKGGLAFCMDGYYSGCFDIDSNDKQTNKAITAIKEALSQPKHCSDCGQKLGDANHIHTCSPQRTWVGLTKEERHEISMANRPYCANVMAAHEEELKRRNT
jgi:hypothetical protein